MNKECRFCKGGLGVSERLDTTIGAKGYIDIMGRYLELNVIDSTGIDLYEGNIKINYCPKCGRYLE